jgi:hypothetical protein
MDKKPTKKQRLKFYTKRQGEDDFKQGFEQSASRRITASQQMQKYEQEARRRDIPVSRVIAESIS